MSRLPGPRTPLGHLLWGVRMLRSPYTTLMALQDRYGPIVKVGMGPLAFVYLLGRDANEMILNTNVNDFSWRDAFASLIPLEGNTALGLPMAPNTTAAAASCSPPSGSGGSEAMGPSCPRRSTEH
ncbi:MAG: hypothetical protein HYR89_11845 [Actinobacteria bacterium]|nr:hypothetical protein [Actinomycetota bacterium]